VGWISLEVANLALSHQTTPSHTKVDTPTAINIERDRVAMETSAAALQGGTGVDLTPVINHPLPGSRALLHIGNTWTTSHALHCPPLDGTEQNSLLALICSSTASRSLTGQPPWTALVWTTPHVLWHGHSALYGSNAQISCGERGTQSCTTHRIIYSD
jgi:hypothetical protein